MSLLQNMPHTVTHSRNKYERDEYIGNISSLTSLATGVSAWVQNASMSEILEFQKRDERITHKVFYAADPDLRPGDEVLVTAGPSFVGKTLNYRASTERSAGKGVLWAIMCEEENNLREEFTD